MSDATPSNSPTTGSLFDATDERLTADLKRGSGKTPAQHPSGELLSRHWVPVFSYARLCTNGAQYAGMLTTAAFTRLFGESVRRTGPKAAWRPQLLVAVRRIAGEWDADKRRDLLHPELRSEPHDKARAADRLLPPENRRLVSRAFHRLPESARCVLWHAEVEAEDLAVPARLLGISVEDASVALDRARELLRQNCLENHRELAPDEECRRYSRLLDVSLRPGGRICPDLQEHMTDCPHCQSTAGQLDQSGGRLAGLLAEGVLGWAAQRYLESRPGRRVRTEETQAGPVVSVAPGMDPHPGVGSYPAAAGSQPGTGTGPVPGSVPQPGTGHPSRHPRKPISTRTAIPSGGPVPGRLSMPRTPGPARISPLTREPTPTRPPVRAPIPVREPGPTRLRAARRVRPRPREQAPTGIPVVGRAPASTARVRATPYGFPRMRTPARASPAGAPRADATSPWPSLP